MGSLTTRDLDQNVLNCHKQIFAKSCVPMAIEFALKLSGCVDYEYYKLQKCSRNNPKSFKDYDGLTISGARLELCFDIKRGPNFPLDKLFEKIHEELNRRKYVVCAWRERVSCGDYHAYVIYGLLNEEFLAVTKWHNNPKPVFIDNMQDRLISIEGSDIIIFK